MGSRAFFNICTSGSADKEKRALSLDHLKPLQIGRVAAQ